TVIASFFGSSQLSQFMAQTNPLDELTHKRRLSALGPGGLTRERAGFEVRDVHHTHYGRVCPIETPEGQNIGLIMSLAAHARINQYGFIETPYRVVKDGVVTTEIRYLSSDEEDRYVIAQANAPLKEDGSFANNLVKARRRGDFPTVSPLEVDYMDVSPIQLVSAAAALIPFLEHDDANRALMGSNMQRQAVPLLKAEAPLVGTGIERRIALDSGAVTLAKADGEVVYVDSSKIVVREKKPVHANPLALDEGHERKYSLMKFQRSNQDCCQNQRPLVRPGDKVKAGEVLADGPATDRGDLALGCNVLCAFMPWHGYNFEDAIVVSERLIRNDVFTSVHIEEYELQVRDTKRGQEELTRDIPNVSDQALRDLDENGIVRVGARVKPGDILVGKVTPKGETELSPEERLLRAIFGEKAGDVRDASLKAPAGMEGVVIDTKIFSRKERDEATRSRNKETIEQIRANMDERAARVRSALKQRSIAVCQGLTAGNWRSEADGTIVVHDGTVLTGEILSELDLTTLRPDTTWTTDSAANGKIEEMVRYAHDMLAAIQEEFDRESEKVVRGDELPPGVIQLVKVYVAHKRKLSVGDKMAGRHGNKGVVAKVVPVEDMPYLPDGTPVDLVLNPLGVPSRMNLGQILETHLGWAA
ncbi:MAG TPA: DNA-directed RNA polymerase subunit beta, partial [Candidatus Latescibacteria bacterium]|nr:DNA-directed RNA polymerase subunit beta [Candidatus Latescibacterota bacterium]